MAVPKSERTAARPTCEAVIGRAPSPYGEVAVRCGQSVGVAAFLDHAGMTHFTCAIHAAGMKTLWPTEGTR